MLLKFSVKNFKNFKDEYILDFTDVSGYQYNDNCIINCGNIKTIGKMLLMGINASGKTNLGEALFNLPNILFSRIYRMRNRTKIINADSDSKVCEFKYDFLIDGCYIRYSYSLDEYLNFVNEKFYVFDEIVYENEADGELNLYHCDKISIDFNLYDGYKKNMTDIYEPIDNNDIGATFNKSSFLQYLFMSSTGDSVLKSLFTFLFGMRAQTPETIRTTRHDIFLKSLYESKEELEKLEDFFNVNNIKCELEIEKVEEYYELYFKFKNGKVSFFDAASSGTKKLYQLYKAIYKYRSTFIYLDEFDAFYHYELSRNVLKFLISSMPNVQIIFTSHNTNLMSNELLRPDCIKIMTKKHILSLAQSTNRELREGHNLEKMYISGEFDTDE